MASVDYTQKEWKDYPDTSTPIMAADLKRIEKGLLEVPRAAVTGFTNQIFGGLLKEEMVEYLNYASGCPISAEVYNPSNGDKLVVWKNYGILCELGVDYTVEFDETNNRYIVKAKDSTTLLTKVYIQTWNIPQNTGGTTSTGITTVMLAGPSGTVGVVSEFEEE